MGTGLAFGTAVGVFLKNPRTGALLGMVSGVLGMAGRDVARIRGEHLGRLSIPVYPPEGTPNNEPKLAGFGLDNDSLDFILPK